MNKNNVRILRKNKKHLTMDEVSFGCFLPKYSLPNFKYLVQCLGNAP